MSESGFTDARNDAIEERKREMYNLYGTIRKILFEGRTAERAELFSELMKAQGTEIGGRTHDDSAESTARLVNQILTANRGAEIIAYKDIHGGLVWVVLDGEIWG